MRFQSSIARGFLRQPPSAAAVAFCAVVALVFASSTLAQYAYDPAAADEQGAPGVRYFGAAKDEQGAFVQGATILIESDQYSFVFVTDDQGRFRGTLPLDATPNVVSLKCWKAGFQFVRLEKRLGPAGAKPSVQVDCVLHTANPK